MLFDETMEGLRSVFDTAAQRTANAVESSRGMVDRARARQRLQDAYRKLGKAEYEAAVNGVTSMEEINGLIAEITDLRQTMLDLERTITRNGECFCPTCGKQNPADFAFCSACGTRLKG